MSRLIIPVSCQTPKVLSIVCSFLPSATKSIEGLWETGVQFFLSTKSQSDRKALPFSISLAIFYPIGHFLSIWPFSIRLGIFYQFGHFLSVWPFSISLAVFHHFGFFYQFGSFLSVWSFISVWPFFSQLKLSLSVWPFRRTHQMLTIVTYRYCCI